jgi:hypothetical protein
LMNPTTAPITIVSKKFDQCTSIVYPNPSNSSITIEINNPALIHHELTIYNSLGRLVSTYEYSNSNQIEIDVSSYDPGIYYYKLQNMSNRQIATGKFSVEY